MTAILLFGQFRLSRSKALLVLASGYVFTATITVAHGLTYPGVFSTNGWLGAGPQSTAWLYMFWHGGFPLFVTGYVLLSGRGADRAFPDTGGMGCSVATASLCAIAAAVALTLLATIGHDALPAIMVGNHYSPTLTVVVSFVWAASLLALGLLWWRHRPATVLDLWLMVVLCAWLLDIALSAMLNGARFDLGFYAGRIYGLLATGFVLARLLLESQALYARLQAAHAELRTSHEKLAEQSRFKSEFLANMSHELRTPLNAIIGFSDLLKERRTSIAPDKDRDYAQHIFESGHHLLSLINDILDLSKIEAGKSDVQLAPLQLQSSVEQAMAMVAERSNPRGVRLQFKGARASDRLLADPRRFKQILLNLMSNAIKFSPHGGVVNISVGQVPRIRAADSMPGFGAGMRLPLPPGDDPSFLELSVSDSGMGIAEDDMQRLFQPFTQVPNVVTRNAEGTGLGLVMVQRLAQLHGGTVAVTSEAGRGSCFTVWLPWREDVASEPQQFGDSHAKPRHSRHALVVEDNSDAAALIRTQLEAEGFGVRHVTSAEAALDLVPSFIPDVITLDIVLPGMDGWEFLERLHSTPRWEGVPVVVVSILAEQGRGFSLGAAMVLQKPIARDALARGLDRLGLTRKSERDVTVLVIDDDPGAVELLSEQLLRRDYTVLRAMGGREGIDLARRFRPDLITLDLDMPEVNGFDVVEALKTSSSTMHIPIVVLTAKDLSSSDRQQLNVHITKIVDKADFNHGRFVGEVQRALSTLS